MSRWILAAALLVAWSPEAQERTRAKSPAEIAPPVREGWKAAEPGYEFRFPRDHGAHRDFSTEWWYFTGHLRSDEGLRFGFELTFFRVGVVPPPKRRISESAWELEEIMLAHFAVTDLEDGDFRYYEKLNRGSPFTADAATDRLDVFNEGWRARLTSDGTIELKASVDEGDGLSLRLRPEKDPVVNGVDGVSLKAEGVGYSSHYYSLTRLSATGELRDEGNVMDVTGSAWMDHEFGSAVLRSDQVGWDWFSLQLDDGTELMLYQIRREDGSREPMSSGSFVARSGEVIHLRSEDFLIEDLEHWTSSETAAAYPVRWRVIAGAIGLDLEVRALQKNQELVTRSSTGITYWEGMVSAAGRSGGTPVRGRGYVEMTGYAEIFSIVGQR
ncbi:MAG: carotenoid 1,2-hydratase [Acidobacteria bacterium]|nr:carotenoid 1,2-hydratase [Acidobacteriota bacterium]